MANITQILNDQISQVATIYGVSVKDWNDKLTWRVDFKPEATQAEKDAAQMVVDNFDVQAELDAVAQKETETEAVRVFARDYPQLVALRTRTPAEIISWIDANITDFASAKEHLKTLTLVIAYLVRRL